MEYLFGAQTELSVAMEKLFINMKKDGKERKILPSYFKNKAELLEKYFNEYSANHSKLLESENREHPYFTGREYESTKQLYMNIKTYIARESVVISSNVANPSTSQEQESVAGSSKAAVPQTASTGSATEGKREGEFEVGQSRYMGSTGSSSNLGVMLHKQAVNFKAFMRTVRNINLENVSEKWKFEDILKELQSRWSAIDSLHWEIDSILDGEDDDYESSFSHHEVIYNDLKHAINTKLWSAVHREHITPQVDIPVFTGEYQQWMSFKNLFNEAVHTNPTLSNSQKMQYLKSKVRGDAERLIQHLQISAQNYISCWEILNHRYENKKLIFSSHISIILNLPSMQVQSLNQIKKMHDSTKECLNAIKNLGVDISTWDPILVHILSQKLDNESLADYVESLKQPRELPILQDFLDYLESKFTMLEQSKRKQEPIIAKPAQYNTNNYSALPRKQHNINNTYQNQRYKLNYSNNQPQNYDFSRHSPKPFMRSYYTSSPNVKCPLCNLDHALFMCHIFLEQSNESKIKTLARLNICNNCLFCHNGKPCFSLKRCKVCAKSHNTILHDAISQQVLMPSQTTSQSKQALRNYKHKNGVSMSHASQEGASEILLATTMLKVLAKDGTYRIMRALVDQGSQISLISEHAAQQLGLKRDQCRGTIFGIGEKESNCKGTINITCASLYNNFTFNTKAFIMNHLIKHLPNTSFEKPTWDYINSINLADPEFYIRRPIDILLGADVYSIIIQEGIIRGETQTQPLAQQSQLGWLLCGSIQSYHCNVVLSNTDEMRKFWENEEISEATESEYSTEDQECMEYYNKTTRRLSNGRYEVRIPFKKQFEHKIGDSKHMAIAQFKNLEIKLSKQPQLASQYKEFINEYIQLQHMKISKSFSTNDFFLPHHAVLRESSSTSKIRVVFNASAKTSTGKSLNDVMCKGPNLQQDLQSIILKWRQYKYAFTADIEKMYRQIMVHEADQRFQKIVWRDHPDKKLQQFQLTTVTYGCKGAPFLAMRTLRQLASDEKERFPEAAKVVEESFYMDDLVHGSHSIEQGQQLSHDLYHLLKSGGFILRKWSSNQPEVLTHVRHDSQESNLFSFKSEDTSKTLGLQWNSSKDQFTFDYNIKFEIKSKMTKRALLAEISKVFDPLGWLSPVVTKLKLLFQSVWHEKLNWDDVIPPHTYREWIKMKEDIENIKSIEIPRWIGCSQGDTIELHGYCDASIKAYAAVVYARIPKEPNYTVVLVAAKTKVVPLKKSISLPRLELCGAQLLSKLIHKIKSCYNQYKIITYGYSDSMVTLSWIQGEEGRWKTYVANRVKNIKSIIPANNWRYVKSKENPADAASRGLTFSQLKNQSLWWRGPQCLSHSIDIKHPTIKYTTNHEIKQNYQTNATTIKQEYNHYIIDQLLEKYSAINKTIRILAWILRMSAKSDGSRLPYISLREFNSAKIRIISHVQRSVFESEIHSLKQNKNLNSQSKLLNLQPFIDVQGLLRVGGRLKNTNLSYDTKHPIIVPHNHRLTSLLIDQAHHLTFHGGPKMTLAALRQQYWILGGNNATKKHLRNCITCRRHSPKLKQQLMGDLPESRCNPAPPFYHTGVDYTGFVDVKCNKGKGIKTTKGYIVIFVCMVTKAVHLELVSDLSSTAYLAALRRMAARRGAPRHIYSDNGTNFIKANRLLQEEYEQIEQIFTSSFYNEITDLKIEWHHNAPSWPTAGGLWERMVSSLKHHLKRVIGNQKLTFEEYTTLLAQLEACLNSRPLCTLSESTEDIDCLTPAHFLQGRAGNTVIETAEDARTRWHLTNQLFKDIWKRWRAEYLTQLTVRQKWHRKQENLSIGDVVVIHDDHLPAGKWAMGRVVELHPGGDELVRVVTLKTKNGYIKRPVTKLSTLPIINEYHNKEIPQNTQQATKTSSPSYKQKRKSFVSFAISFLLFSSLITTTTAKYSISKLKQNNQSLYFDSMGDMQLIRDDWTMIAYYNMSPYWEGIEVANKYTKHLQKTCDELGNVHCNTVLSQLHHDQLELIHYNNVLLSPNHDLPAPGGHTIRRRGLVNAVGRIANTLFGVLDDSFAEQYKKDIALLQQNNKHINALWKNQTSIIEGQYNLLKRTEEIMNKQHKVINKHLNQLDKTTNYVSQQMQKLSKMEDFTLSSLTAIQILNNLGKIQDTLLNTLTDVYHGRFNLHLLTPEQFQLELRTISGQLPKDLRLPIDDFDSNYRDIYHLLSIKARLLKEYFIFEIKIPLISRDDYQLYKLVPIPHRQNKQMIVVVPSADYVAINLRKDALIETERAELERCLHYKEISLCPLHRPIKHLSNKEKFCKLSNQAACDLLVTQCKDQWYELTEPSTHLYFHCDPYPLRVICDNEINSVVLEKAGLIHLGSNCIAKGLDFTFHAHKHQQNIVQISPDLPNIEIAPINSVLNLTIPLLPENISDSDLVLNRSLSDMKQQIMDMKKNQDLDTGEWSVHDIHQYAISYVAVGGVAAISLAWFCWKRRAARSLHSVLQLQHQQATELPSVVSVVQSGVRVRDQPGEVQTNMSARPQETVDSATSPIVAKRVYIHKEDETML